MLVRFFAASKKTADVDAVSICFDTNKHEMEAIVTVNGQFELE